MVQIATFFVALGNEAEQAVLNAFLRGHRILQIDRQFVDRGWAFCVEYLAGRSSEHVADWRSKRIDYREVLDEEAFARFSRLRERRKAIALEDGVPPYMVMTDAQMAEAAKAKDLTLETLARIDGFGEARIKRYGERLLG